MQNTKVLNESSDNESPDSDAIVPVTKRIRRMIVDSSEEESRRDYHQVDEQDPYLPPSAASQAIAARTLRGQGSYPPTAPPLNSNALGTHNTIKQPLLLTPPPPSYATATARARQLHESMLKGGGVNGSGGGGDHKSSQHNQQSTGGRAEHRSGLGDQPGQYATLSKQCKTLESSDFY